MIETLKDILFAFFHPRFWLMNNRYSSDWDNALKTLMANNKFENTNTYSGYVDIYSAKLGDIYVWITNYPYCCMHPYKPHDLRIRPKRRTVYIAWKKLHEDCMNGVKKSDEEFIKSLLPKVETTITNHNSLVGLEEAIEPKPKRMLRCDKIVLKPGLISKLIHKVMR